MMISCREYARRVAEGSLDELSLLRRLEVQLHLLMCHHCRRYARQMAQLSEAVRRILGGPRPEDEAIADGIEEHVIEHLRRRHEES